MFLCCPQITLRHKVFYQSYFVSVPLLLKQFEVLLSVGKVLQSRKLWKGAQTKNSQGGREMMSVPGAGTGHSLWQTQVGAETSQRKAEV